MGPIRLRRPAHLLQQGEVLHVAGPDLEDIRILGHPRDIPWVEHLGDNGQPCLLLGFFKDFESLESEPLERVGRRPGLEGAAAEHVRPRRLDGTGRLEDLDLAFDTAGSGDHGESAPDGYTGDVDYGSVFVLFQGEFQIFHSIIPSTAAELDNVRLQASFNGISCCTNS